MQTGVHDRGWGVYAVELTGRVYVTGVVDGGPAQTADIREGDVISEVADHEINSLPEFYKQMWAVGPAGSAVPLTTIRPVTAFVSKYARSTAAPC